jgi:SAM-dependent methyltransferase
MNKKKVSMLVSEISERFGVGFRFASMYLENNYPGIKYNQSLNSFYQSLSSLQKLYFDFALSTNQRGDDIFKLLEPFIAKRKKGRFLDIGCGYAGFVRAFLQHDYEAIGIEIDPTLSAYSQANLSDYGFSKRLIVNSDFQTVNLSALNKFDVLSCNDVIEHVSDPELTIERIGKISMNGSILFMEIPNKDSVNFVLKDGHFQLFGITQLSRQEAREYKRQLTGIDNYDHMGEYYPLDYYIDLLKKQGFSIIQVMVRHKSFGRNEVEEKVKEIRRQISLLGKNKKLNFFMRKRLELSLLEYIDLLQNDFTKLKAEEIEKKYLADFWTIIATKSESNNAKFRHTSIISKIIRLAKGVFQP